MRIKNKIKKRIIELIELAYITAKKGDLEIAREYIKLAEMYSRKGRVKIPLKYKRMFCRKCYTPLIIGVTERRRIRSKILIRTCLICNWQRRYVLSRNKGSNKEN
ncbi:ribonuclease P [Sulfolobus sp. E5-1-F]|uniref:ribonuclease P protein component 4 n=1 Tax=Sulfolobaceae TaxID=118883 RepID=UPI0012951BD7|nr:MULTISPECIES: ribonuclease P protein component 4 [unclassified Sulfolobus]QGA53395.1 ribonuclease P [Sulfolobus sp. E5-1-F]QGA68499.1 ribonuclease P [Sulfolobus sp. E11-6]